MQHHYFREEPMCKAILFHEDKNSVNSTLAFIRTWMKDSTSIVALSTASERIVGVAVTRITSDLDKSDIYNRIQVHMTIKECHKYRECLTIGRFE